MMPGTELLGINMKPLKETMTCVKAAQLLEK